LRKCKISGFSIASHEEKSLFTDIKKDCNEFRSTKRENLNKKEIYLNICIIFAGAVMDKKFITFKHNKIISYSKKIYGEK